MAVKIKQVLVSVNPEIKNIYSLEVPPENRKYVSIYRLGPYGKFNISVDWDLFGDFDLTGVNISKEDFIHISSKQRPPVDVDGILEVWRKEFNDLAMFNRHPDSMFDDRVMVPEFEVRTLDPPHAGGKAVSYLRLNRVGVIV